MSLKNIAQQTLSILREGQFVTPSGQVVQFATTQQKAQQGTKLYRPDAVTQLLDGPTHADRDGATRSPTIEVTDESHTNSIPFSPLVIRISSSR